MQTLGFTAPVVCGAWPKPFPWIPPPDTFVQLHYSRKGLRRASCSASFVVWHEIWQPKCSSITVYHTVLYQAVPLQNSLLPERQKKGVPPPPWALPRASARPTLRTAKPAPITRSANKNGLRQPVYKNVFLWGGVFALPLPFSGR